MSDPSKTGVWVWLGISKPEIDKLLAQRIPGTCIKCGKPTVHGYTLCKGHRTAYRRWVLEQEHPIPADIGIKLLERLYYECPMYRDDRFDFGLTYTQFNHQLQKLRRKGLIHSGANGRRHAGYWLTVEGAKFLEGKVAGLDRKLCAVKAIREAA